MGTASTKISAIARRPATIELRYRDALIETFPRPRGDKTHRIDYRHIIGSLVRKPGAFAHYRFREEPTAD